MASTERIDRQLDLRAAEWLIRLEDAERPVNSRQQAEFFAWLRRSPQHIQAFFEVADLWRGLERLDAGQQIDIEKMLAGRFASISRLRNVAGMPGQPAASGAQSHRFARSSRSVWLAAAAVTVFGCGLSFFGWRWLHDSPVYATSVSEQRTFRLADGSVLHLNTRSRARVSFSERERGVELLDGEALFSVARDANRPFVVRTGSATVRVVGTQFNVRQQADLTTVAVVDGKVQVFADGSSTADSRAPTLLAAGESARVSAGHVVKRNAASVADAVAWRERRLIFRDASLAEVTAEFNRYNTLQFRLADDVSASKHLTGIFSADHPQSLILYLERENDLDVRETNEGIVIAAKSGAAATAGN